MIRPYQPEDEAALLTVWEAASRLAHPFLEEAFLASERQAIPEKYLPLADTYVFVQKEEVVGFIALLGHEVGGLFVAPRWHGQGIGYALMNHAATLHPEKLEVEVFAANTIGRRFYERYGFQVLHEHEHPATGQPVLRLRYVSSIG